MKYGSLFTGICGFDLALSRAGMECSWQVEIDKNCQQVEERHYPNVKRYEDVKAVGKHNLAAVDLICGGFPCQDLSVAGKRAGLAGERSGLWTEFHRIIAELRPQWVVIENVPGLLSSNKGRDFAVILRGLVECGYGVCWRVLDAQYFGVAQRRRRVFIVGSLGDGRAAEVLFEREGGAGDTPPSREAGQGIAHAISASPTATGRLDPNGQDFVTSTLRGFGHGWQGQHNSIAIRPAQTGSNGWGILQDGSTHTLDGTGGDIISFIPGQSAQAYGIAADENVTPPLRAGNSGTNQTPTIAWEMQHASEAYRESGNVAPNLRARMGTGGNNVPMVGVRRLTPVECERLQGFPDGWTAGQADSTRYRQLGNAVAAPVVEWIAKRIVSACFNPRLRGGGDQAQAMDYPEDEKVTA
jgi:DNA (cytosine-5)-methyltransferase 1